VIDSDRWLATNTRPLLENLHVRRSTKYDQMVNAFLLFSADVSNLLFPKPIITWEQSPSSYKADIFVFSLNKQKCVQTKHDVSTMGCEEKPFK